MFGCYCINIPTIISDDIKGKHRVIQFYRGTHVIPSTSSGQALLPSIRKTAESNRGPRSAPSRFQRAAGPPRRHLPYAVNASTRFTGRVQRRAVESNHGHLAAPHPVSTRRPDHSGATLRRNAECRRMNAESKNPMPRAPVSRFAFPDSAFIVRHSAFSSRTEGGGVEPQARRPHPLSRRRSRHPRRHLPIHRHTSTSARGLPA